MAKKALLDAKEQKKLKGVSKAIYIIAKICRIFVWIAAVCVAMCAVILPIVGSKIQIAGNNSIVIFKEKVEFSSSGNKLIMSQNGEEISSIEIKEGFTPEDFIEQINRLPIKKLVTLGTVLIIFATATIVIGALIFARIEKIFKNISESETPFIEENITHLQIIIKLTIASLIVSIITSIFASIAMNSDVNIEFVNVYEILVLIAIMYIYKYGYNLENSKK